LNIYFLSTVVFGIWNKIKQGPIWEKYVKEKNKIIRKEYKQNQINIYNLVKRQINCNSALKIIIIIKKKYI
jgi:hypothetical protein